MFPKVLQIFCVPCIDNTGYSAYVCFHAGQCSDMRYNVPGIWWDTRRCVSVKVRRFWQHIVHVWMIVEYLELCWCVMCGHVIKHSEMVDVCAGHFGVRECKGVEGIWMMLKISKMHKCQNMRKYGSTCVEQVHTHHCSPSQSTGHSCSHSLATRRSHSPVHRKSVHAPLFKEGFLPPYEIICCLIHILHFPILVPHLLHHIENVLCLQPRQFAHVSVMALLCINLHLRKGVWDLRRQGHPYWSALDQAQKKEQELREEFEWLIDIS